MLENLRKLREERGLSRREVAEILSVSAAVYTALEQGKRKRGIDLIIKLADYYNTSVDYILGITDDPVAQAGTG